MTRRLSRHNEPEFAAMLTNVFGIMLAGGIQTEAIRALSLRSLMLAEKKSQSSQRHSSGGLPLAGLVLDAWHRDRRYLDSKGEPRAVRLFGQPPSLEALIRAEQSRKDAKDLAQRFKVLGLVVSVGPGLYKPAGDIALISKYDPFVLQHVAKSISALLQTIQGNVNGSNTSERLLERFAEVPDLPNEWVPAFQRFTKLHGWILVRTVNDWLESRRARRTSRGGKGTTRAGIHVHAYISKKQQPKAIVTRGRRVRA